MFSIPAFLDRAKKGANVTTDYALAKVLGHRSQANVSNWRLEKAMPDERAIVKLCELTGDDPRYVAAEIQAMRAANDDAASLWRDVASALQGGLQLLVLVVILSVVMVDQAVASPVDAGAASAGLIVMSNLLRRFILRWLQRRQSFHPA